MIDGMKKKMFRNIIRLIIISAILLLTGCAGFSPSDSESPTPFAPTPSITAMETPQTSDNLSDIVDPNHTYSYEQMIADAKALTAQYPELISTDVIGYSVEDREMLLIRLGRGEKKVVLAGAHHAREYITSTFLMETVDEYAQAYYGPGNFGGYDVRTLLNSLTIYIVPMVNPDGVNLVQNGVESVLDPEKVMSMRMMKNGYDEWKANINGVDLNRQYPCYWDEKASNTDVPSSEMYKGEAPATEPEVLALIALCEENDFVLAASFHTKGEVIYWADSGTEQAIAADDSIAQTLADVTGYDLQPVSQDPSQYGAGFENWFRQEYELPAFCIELTPTTGDSAPHDDSMFSDIIWSKASCLCAELMAQAVLIEP